jgi:hypothetical protein
MLSDFPEASVFGSFLLAYSDLLHVTIILHAFIKLQSGTQMHLLGGSKVEFHDISKTKFSGNICFLLYKLRNYYEDEHF